MGKTAHQEGNRNSVIHTATGYLVVWGAQWFINAGVVGCSLEVCGIPFPMFTSTRNRDCTNQKSRTQLTRLSNYYHPGIQSASIIPRDRHDQK
jgi:hypothetical protein